MSAEVAHLLATAGLTLPAAAFAIAAAVGLAALLIRCLQLLDAADPSEAPPSRGEGGGGCGRPDLPADRPGGDGAAPWWPDFERQLAAWAVDRRATGPRRAV